MTKILTRVAAFIGPEMEEQDFDDFLPGFGSEAYKKLVRGEDIVANTEIPGRGKMTSVVPFHAVNYATVERESVTGDDPVDALCVPAPNEAEVSG